MRDQISLGTFSTEIEIGTPDGSHYETVSALVDTGAGITAVPASMLQQLGVRPHDQLTFALADGRRIQSDVGQTWMRIRWSNCHYPDHIWRQGNATAAGRICFAGLDAGSDTPDERLVLTDALLM